MTENIPPELKPLSFFKDSKGSWRTQSLFVEFERPPHVALWTLGEDNYEHEDGRFFPSLRKIYLSYNHIPGYEHKFVSEQIGSYPFWLRLSKSSFIAKHIQEWREELEVKIRSESMEALIRQSREPNGTTAAKYLADKGWVGSGRGRPTKKEKEALSKGETREASEIYDDFKRIKSVK